ncbi:hypothetical protein ABMA58_08830, partial [Oceanospirillum sp. HFRX-1_2]
GCSGNTKSDEIPMTEHFKLGKVSVEFSQRIQPEKEFYAESVVKAKIASALEANLEKRNLLSSQEEMYTLHVDVQYDRRFVADATPVPTDSLAYPHLAFQIKVMDDGEVLKTINFKKRQMTGGFATNMKVMSAVLRDAEDEDMFLESAGEIIAKEIDKLN